MRTQEEIKTGLNCCAGNSSCRNCPFDEYRDENSITTCTSELANAALEVFEDFERREAAGWIQ